MLRTKSESRIKLSDKEILELNKAKKTITRILNDHHITKGELINLLFKEKDDVLIPLSIFSTNTPPLEVLVYYLINEGFSISQIARLTERSYTTIWLTHKKKNKTKRNKKKSGKKRVLNNNILLPISIFNDQLSILESIVKYLKEVLNLRYYEIANLLGRDNRTVWTVYKRVKEKERRK